jgi:hypothetical protein
MSFRPNRVKAATWWRFSKRCARPETGVEGLAAWEQLLAEVFANPEFGEWFGRMTLLIESGRREFYNSEV